MSQLVPSEPDNERRYTAWAQPEANPRRVTGTDGGGATASAGLSPRHRPPPFGAVQAFGQVRRWEPVDGSGGG